MKAVEPKIKKSNILPDNFDKKNVDFKILDNIVYRAVNNQTELNNDAFTCFIEHYNNEQKEKIANYLINLHNTLNSIKLKNSVTLSNYGIDPKNGELTEEETNKISNSTQEEKGIIHECLKNINNINIFFNNNRDKLKNIGIELKDNLEIKKASNTFLSKIKKLFN